MHNSIPGHISFCTESSIKLGITSDIYLIVSGVYLCVNVVCLLGLW